MPDIATLKGLRCPHCGGEQLTVTGVKGALGASAVTSLAFGAVGNLVAGKNAAANTATEPLQYKCTNCGNKFESLPLGAPPEEILDAPCTVTFTRESSMIGAAVPQILYLNGVKLGAVKNGASLSFSTSSRYNVLFVTDQHGVAFKSEYRFEAQPGGCVATRFKLGFHDAPAVSVSSVATETPRAQIQIPAVSRGQARRCRQYAFVQAAELRLARRRCSAPSAGKSALYPGVRRSLHQPAHRPQARRQSRKRRLLPLVYSPAHGCFCCCLKES